MEDRRDQVRRENLTFRIELLDHSVIVLTRVRDILLDRPQLIRQFQEILVRLQIRITFRECEQ